MRFEVKGQSQNSESNLQMLVPCRLASHLQEVADAIAFRASEDASYTNRVEINANGES
jgi:hypothetical protein